MICTGDSSTHVEGISGSIQEVTRKQLTDRPWHVEGMGHSEWVLLDYVNVVVHVFQREPRDFYNLERLWADAIVVEHAEDGSEKMMPPLVKKVAVKKIKKDKPKAEKKAVGKSGVVSKAKPTSAPKAVIKAKAVVSTEVAAKPRATAKPKSVSKSEYTKPLLTY